MANQHDELNDGWETFTYVNEPTITKIVHKQRIDSGAQADSASSQPADGLRPLTSVPVGDRVCIVGLDCGGATNRFLGMGLAPGAVLEVISATTTGSVIVALGAQRLGLGADIAQHIQVAELANSATELPITAGSIATRPTPLPVVKLRNATIGATLRIIGYEPTARHYKRKLLAMGLTPGTEVVIKRHAPLGDPTEITVRDFHLSLRKAEADALIIEAV